MINQRLYDLASQYEFLLRDLYDEETGVVNETALAKLNDLKDPIETKCINITKVLKDIEKERVAIEIEKKNMAAREKALKNQVDKLKEYLQTNMERCRITEVKCPQFVIKLQKNPFSLEKYDETQIPKAYYKINIELDEQKVREDLKKGIEIPGARLIQRNSVRIK